MPNVVALYRYPIKSFTPETSVVLTVLNEGRIAGDRVLGIRLPIQASWMIPAVKAQIYLTLRVVGDGITSRYQDKAAGQITLHSGERLAAVA